MDNYISNLNIMSMTILVMNTGTNTTMDHSKKTIDVKNNFYIFYFFLKKRFFILFLNILISHWPNFLFYLTY